MAFMASGEQHGFSHDTSETPPRRAGGRQARRRAGSRLSLLSFVLSAVVLAGLAAMMLLGVPPAGVDREAARPPLTAYKPAPTPALDALGDRLMQKPDIWIPVADPEPLFKVRSLELVDLPSRYEVREHGRGGRLDLMSFGDFGGPGLHLHVVVYRMGGEAPAPSTLFVDLARRAAESGVGVTALGTPMVHETKFGTAEIAGAALNVAGRERACQAFRLDAVRSDAASAAPHQILGWTCDDEPVTDAEIACFIDHLSLTEATSDGQLQSLFAEAAHRQRPECGGVPQPVPPKGA